ncbi:hypothetical protein DAEQUDRAFT_21468 [Daedalea quercina L-15889]|uniref:Uncharacterized protein n=1 Tax=Daedalea quercina L-15889 TaxID=1314783 RepID=A0A165ULS5_9APHY|nr:hypothetical protein DAEQUDRAFT_21468 [Daedalea quercina L-15889]
MTFARWILDSRSGAATDLVPHQHDPVVPMFTLVRVTGSLIHFLNVCLRVWGPRIFYLAISRRKRPSRPATLGALPHPASNLPCSMRPNTYTVRSVSCVDRWSEHCGSPSLSSVVNSLSLAVHPSYVKLGVYHDYVWWPSASSDVLNTSPQPPFSATCRQRWL